jgi:ATP-dependent DNA helicase RecG
MGKENGLQVSIRALKGVGPKIAGFLEERDIATIEDLFYFLPVRYEDRRQILPIAGLAEKEKAVIVARVTASRSLFFRNSRKKAYEATVEDDTGSLSIIWFRWNRGYLKKVCKKGLRLLISGQVKGFGGRLQMVHPDITILDEESEEEAGKTILPVYPEIEGIKQGTLRNLIRQAFEDHGASIVSPIPEKTGTAHGLVPLLKAFQSLHFPEGAPLSSCPTPDFDLRAGSDAFRRRIILEEYFHFQFALVMKKGELRKEKGIRFRLNGKFCSRFVGGLPFELTAGQQRVMKEIRGDMTRREPMNRLLQGDVGCGKTICAVLAALTAIDNGYQVAFMAPTEILAEQHYLTIHRYFQDMGIDVAFLRGQMGSDRKQVLEGVRRGESGVVVGTHALLQKDVTFKNLGLVVIDEQHRFGVLQRKVLREKGSVEPATRNPSLAPAVIPHVLVMTATPIPRTLSMVVYGDLDVSVINEMPAGRQKIETKVYLDKDRPSVYKAVDAEVKKGHQVYIVYPLVDESDKIELQNATEMAAYFQESVFPSQKVGLLHGRMGADEKEKVMIRFKNRDINILVCTTVIEVGIDVPAATMIVVEHAERFGLSQLHQLRGRVGRGIHPSRCVLVTASKRTEVATKRLKVMEESTDGFRIAEEDMKIRGPGDMLGVRQSGIPKFRIGDIVRDVDIMTQARRLAEEALPTLDKKEVDRLRTIIEYRWGDTIHLSTVG